MQRKTIKTAATVTVAGILVAQFHGLEAIKAANNFGNVFITNFAAGSTAPVDGITIYNNQTSGAKYAAPTKPAKPAVTWPSSST